MWLPAFSRSYPMPMPELITPAYGFIWNVLNFSPVWFTIIAMILVFCEAVLLNNLLSDSGLTPKNSYFTAFVYIVLMSCSTNYLTLHPVLLVNILIIFLLRMIFIANQKDDSLKEIFSAGILTALCSLFIFKSAGLLMAIWFFLMLLRVYNWRLWTVNLFGFLTVYLYVFSWYLFTDQLIIKLRLYKTVLQSVHLVSWSLHLSVYEYILMFLILFILFISVVNFLFNVNEKLISLRRISMVLLWLLIISIISVSIYITNPVFDFAYLLLPVSILATLYYSNIKKSFFGEVLILLLIIMVFLCRI
jgi:hypothetical protein